MNPPGATQTTEFSNPLRSQALGFETTLGSNLNLMLSQIRTFYGDGQGFTAQNFPNPRAYIHDISLRTHIQVRNPSLLDTFFGIQGQPPSYQPPNNPALPDYNISLRTHLQDTKLNLLDRDTMFAAAGKVPEYVWELPIRTVFSLASYNFTQELKLNLLSQDAMVLVPGMALENIQFTVVNHPTYLYYGIGLQITEPSLVLPMPEEKKVTVVFVANFGPSFIIKSIELK